MTKTIERILLLCLVAAMLGSVALADMECTPLSNATLSVANGTYTAELADADGGANGYALLVISVDKSVATQIKEDIAAGTVQSAYGWSIRDDTIQYIGQEKTASFTFKPMANKTSVVLLGGANTSPIILGVLESKGLPGDVNGSGDINGEDRTLLVHFDNGWNETQDSRLKDHADSIQQNGDLTGEGEINGEDRTLLVHFDNGWNETQDSRLTAYKALIGQ